MDYAAFASKRDREDHAASGRVVYEGARRRGKRGRGIAVRKNAPDARGLKKDLDRYERDCQRSAPKRFKGKRRKKYCAGVAWKRARMSKKHPSYFRTVKENMTMARRKRRMPKRGPGGKFVKRARAAAAEAPRRRRRRRARAAAAETPRRRRRRARAAAAAPRRRAKRRHTSHAAAPRRRRRRARAMAAAPRRRRRRRSRAHDPRGTHVYRRRPRIRRRTRRVGGRRRRVTLVSPRRHRRARALENPLTGGELVVGGFTGVLGFVSADVLDRFLATHAFTATTTQGGSTDTPAAGQVYNYQAVAAPMGIKRWGAGLGMAAVPIVLAGFVKGPKSRAALQFYGIGALLRTLGKGATDLMVMLTGKTNFGMRAYADEISASNAMKSATANNAALPAVAPISLGGVNVMAGAHGSQARRGIAGCCSNCAAGMPCSKVAAAPQADPRHAAGVPDRTAGVPEAARLPPPSARINSPIPKPVLGVPSWRSKRDAA